jgi:hypothetical protein
VKPLITIVCLGVLLMLPSLAASQSVFISEILVGNDRGYCDSFGDDPDWIELFNPSDKPVDLSGWALTDDPGESLQRWLFPKGTVLAPRSYLVVFVRNKKARDSTPKELHANFRLDARVGEVIVLLNPSKVEVHRIRFGVQARDVSLGTSDRLEPATPQKWPTPGVANGSPRPPSRCS